MILKPDEPGAERVRLLEERIAMLEYAMDLAELYQGALTEVIRIVNEAGAPLPAIAPLMACMSRLDADVQGAKAAAELRRAR